MGDSTGAVRKISWGRTTLVIPNNMEVNLWKGGWVNVEAQDNVGSKTPVTEFRGGILSGVQTRCSEPGYYDKIVDLIKKTTEGDEDIVITIANGDKYSAPCFSTIDPTAFFSNRDGLAKFDLHPRGAEFSKV